MKYLSKIYIYLIFFLLTLPVFSDFGILPDPRPVSAVSRDGSVVCVCDRKGEVFFRRFENGKSLELKRYKIKEIPESIYIFKKEKKLVTINLVHKKSSEVISVYNFSGQKIKGWKLREIFSYEESKKFVSSIQKVNWTSGASRIGNNDILFIHPPLRLVVESEKSATLRLDLSSLEIKKI